MTKSVTGESFFKFNGEKYKLRLDFEAVKAIEDTLDQSIFSIFASGEMPKITTLAILADAMSEGEIDKLKMMEILQSGQAIALFTEIANVVSRTFNPEGKTSGGKRKKAKPV